MKTASKTHRLAGVLCVLAGLFAGTASAVAAEVPRTATQVEQFVSAIWIEGVPYEIASRISPEVALPVLQKILSDPAASAHWANAAVTAGMIGEERSADLLIDFILRGDARGKLDSDQTRAKTSAVMSLGYVVNKSGSRKALDFLSAATDPKFWSARKVGWTGAHLATAKERNSQLATMAVLGLGVSGNVEAAKVLRSLAASKSATPELENAVRDALWANEAIYKEGLRNYYRTRMKAPEQTLEMTQPDRPPEKGEILREAQPGEVVRQNAPGEVVAEPRAGEVVRKMAPGTVLSEPPRDN